MTTKIQKWGNSLALRIPKSFAKDVHLESGASVNLSIANGRLVVEPSPKTKYSLSELLKGVTKKDLHSEIDWGRPVGKEVW